MSFNGSGTFVINSTGQPVVTGTVISSSTFNSLTADLGTGLSTTVTKDGQTTTTAKIPFALGLSAAAASNFAAGTVGLPAIYLSTDTTTGLYRIGANNDGFAVSGAKVLDIASTGLGVTGTLSATGVSSFAAGTVGAPSIYLGSDTTTGLYRIGANNDGFAVSGAKVLDIASTGLGITGTLKLAGATSGTTTVIATDAVTATITLPSATATLATLGANTFTGTQTLTGGGSGGLILGYGGISTYGAIWSNQVSPSTSNYALFARADTTQINAPTGGAIYLGINSNTTLQVNPTGAAVTGTLSATGAVVCSAGSGYTFKGAGVSTSAMFSGQCANGTDFQWGPDIGVSSIYRVQNSAGTGVYLTSGNTAWTANSDERLKDIAGEFTGALDFIVSKVRTVRGTWKADETKRSRSFLLAQDWQDYLPEGIEVSADGILGLTKEDTIPVAFAAIKELAAMVKDLTARLAALEAK